MQNIENHNNNNNNNVNPFGGRDCVGITRHKKNINQDELLTIEQL